MSNILRRGRLEAAQDEEILHYTSSMELTDGYLMPT